jgi:hypothetical protein
MSWRSTAKGLLPNLIAAVCLLVGGIVFGESRAAAQAGESKRLRVLLVIDSMAKGIGQSVQVDGRNMQRWLKGHVPPPLLDLKLLSGQYLISDSTAFSRSRRPATPCCGGR